MYGFEDLVSYALIINGGHLTTFQKAIVNQEKCRWMGAIVEEMESLHKNQTYELVELPERKRWIGGNGCIRRKKQYLKKGKFEGLPNSKRLLKEEMG